LEDIELQVMGRNDDDRMRDPEAGIPDPNQDTSRSRYFFSRWGLPIGIVFVVAVCVAITASSQVKEKAPASEGG
jgi:hypothetical protein